MLNFLIGFYDLNLIYTGKTGFPSRFILSYRLQENEGDGKSEFIIKRFKASNEAFQLLLK